MQDDAGRKGVGEISNSIRPINVDIAHIHIELCRVFVVIADNVKLCHFVLDAETCVEEFVKFQMGDSDRDGQIVGFARHVLFEIHFFDEIFEVELNSCQDAFIISACSSDNDTLKRVMRA